jgi:hypothetical protein
VFYFSACKSSAWRDLRRQPSQTPVHRTSVSTDNLAFPNCANHRSLSRSPSRRQPFRAPRASQGREKTGRHVQSSTPIAVNGGGCWCPNRPWSSGSLTFRPLLPGYSGHHNSRAFEAENLALLFGRNRIIGNAAQRGGDITLVDEEHDASLTVKPNEVAQIRRV